jgi:hypothetical protein
MGEEPRRLRSRAGREPAGRRDRAHEREVARSDLADLAARRELAQSVEREGDVPVEGDAGVVKDALRWCSSSCATSASPRITR